MRTHCRRTLLAFPVLCVLACSPSTAPLDAGDVSDAPETIDAGADAGAPLDAPAADVGPADARDFDSGPLGGTTPDSLRIEGVIRARPGLMDVALEDVVVTYVKRGDLGDVGGFFVQDEATGPALFVEEGAALPVVSPMVGDRVAFRVTETLVRVGATRAVQIEGFTTLGSGENVELFRQDVTATADLVTRVDLYASELIAIDAEIAGPWEVASMGHMRAPITTSAIPTTAPAGMGGLFLRVPTPTFDTSTMGVGCAIHVDGLLWRFNLDAQVATYLPGELTVSGCP